MADITDTLKGLLGNDDKLSGIMNAISDDSKPPADGAQMLMQAQALMRELSSAGDSRAGLLAALKPYMNKNRQGAIDNAVRLLNILRLAEMFGGGKLNV